MLIPSIDLQGGRIVQLQQGERLVVSSDDLDGWIARFAAFPLIQVVDLDRAKGQGDNDAMVRRILAARPCQLGGGIRTPDAAARWIEAGAVSVIVGSALFPGGRPDAAVAAAFAERVGRDRLLAAVDARHGRVAVGGWRSDTSTLVADAIRALEPAVGGFLATFIEGEGLLGGLPLDRIARLRAITPLRLIAAGGIRSRDEVDALAALRVDAVVGMAIYTGVMSLDPEPPS